MHTGQFLSETDPNDNLLMRRAGLSKTYRDGEAKFQYWSPLSFEQKAVNATAAQMKYGTAVLRDTNGQCPMDILYTMDHCYPLPDNDNCVFNLMMMIAFGEMMTIVFDKMMRS